MLNRLSIKPFTSQFEALQSLQPEQFSAVNDVEPLLIDQSQENHFQGLEEAFSRFLNENTILDDRQLEFDKIQQKITQEFCDFIKDTLPLKSPNPDTFSDQAIRECFLLFRGVFQSVLSESKIFSKPLKTYADVTLQLNREKKFLTDFTKLQKNPLINSQTRKITIASLVQKGFVLEKECEDKYYYYFAFLAAPISKLFCELLMVRGMINETVEINFQEPCSHHLLMDFYLKQIEFNPQTFDFDINTESYLNYFGLGFHSFICQPGILEIYNQFLQDQQTARYKKIKEENEQILSQKLLQERLDLEKKFSKELSLERKNVFKQAESSLKLDFQSFLFEMLKIFEEGFQERKEISLNNEYLSFLNLQSQALSEMAKERKVLLFNQGLKQGKIAIGAHSQELSSRRDLSQQRLLELIQIKKQEKKEKEVTLKTASIFSRKMMYNLTNDVPATALKWVRLKSLQSDADYLLEKLQQQEESSYNDILLKSKLAKLEMKESDLRKQLEKEARYTLLAKLEMKESDLRKQLEKEVQYTLLLAKLEMKESDLRKQLEKEAQYTLIKAHNPYGMRPLKCPRLNLT